MSGGASVSVMITSASVAAHTTASAVCLNFELSAAPTTLAGAGARSARRRPMERLLE